MLHKALAGAGMLGRVAPTMLHSQGNFTLKLACKSLAGVWFKAYTRDICAVSARFMTELARQDL